MAVDFKAWVPYFGVSGCTSTHPRLRKSQIFSKSFFKFFFSPPPKHIYSEGIISNATIQFALRVYQSYYLFILQTLLDVCNYEPKVSDQPRGMVLSCVWSQRNCAGRRLQNYDRKRKFFFGAKNGYLGNILGLVSRFKPISQKCFESRLRLRQK